MKLGQTVTGRFSMRKFNNSNIPKCTSDHFVDAAIYGTSMTSIIIDDVIDDKQLNLILHHEKILVREAKVEQLLMQRSSKSTWIGIDLAKAKQNLIAYMIMSKAEHCSGILENINQLELNFNKPISMKQAGIAWHQQCQKRKGKGGKRLFR